MNSDKNSSDRTLTPQSGQNQTENQTPASGWIAVNNGRFWEIRAADRKALIGDTLGSMVAGVRDGGKSSAILMAAAPELLKALELVKHEIACGAALRSSAVDAINSAIAKARGK